MNARGKVKPKGGNNSGSDEPVQHGQPDNVLSLIHMLSNRIGRAFYGQVEAKHGLSLAEWRVILTLHHDPKLTAVEITNRWAMDKMAVSRAIRTLEDRGWVKRSRKKNDRRSYALSLTTGGQRAYEKVLPTANARYHDIVSTLSKAEVVRLRKSLDKLIDHAVNLND